MLLGQIDFISLRKDKKIHFSQWFITALYSAKNFFKGVYVSLVAFSNLLTSKGINPFLPSSLSWRVKISFVNSPAVAVSIPFRINRALFISGGVSHLIINFESISGLCFSMSIATARFEAPAEHRPRYTFIMVDSNEGAYKRLTSLFTLTPFLYKKNNGIIVPANAFGPDVVSVLPARSENLLIAESFLTKMTDLYLSSSPILPTIVYPFCSASNTSEPLMIV